MLFSALRCMHIHGQSACADPGMDPGHPEGALWKILASSEPPTNGSSSSSVLERADGESGSSASRSPRPSPSGASASASMIHVRRASVSADHHLLTCSPKESAGTASAGERDGGPEPRSSTQRLRRERPTMVKGAVSERESKRRAEAPVVRREWPERRHVERACVGHAPMTAPIRHASGSQWHARALHGRQATCLSRKPHGCWPVGHTRSLAASSR